MIDFHEKRGILEVVADFVLSAMYKIAMFIASLKRLCPDLRKLFGH